MTCQWMERKKKHGAHFSAMDSEEVFTDVYGDLLYLSLL